MDDDHPLSCTLSLDTVVMGVVCNLSVSVPELLKLRGVTKK